MADGRSMGFDEKRDARGTVVGTLLIALAAVSVSASAWVMASPGSTGSAPEGAGDGVGGPAAAADSSSRGCAKRETVGADVDGDGTEDRVFHDWIRHRAVLGVCTAAGEKDRISGNGQAELLEIVDVEGDGVDEILFGGTTVAARLAEVAVFADGALHRVRGGGSGSFVLVDGFDPEVLTSATPAGGAVGCEDTDGDGAGEVVQVTVTARGSRNLQWIERAYAIEAGAANPVSERRGSRDNDPARNDAREVVEVAHTLTAACDGADSS